MNLIDRILRIENELRDLVLPYGEHQIGPGQSRDQRISEVIQAGIRGLAPGDADRVIGEFQGVGPLGDALRDPQVTEIILNGPERLWTEREGRLERIPDRFASELSYRNFCHRLLAEARLVMTSENPVAQGNFRGFRVHMVGGELTAGQAHICLRRHPESPWTFERLEEIGWGTPEQRERLKDLVRDRLNFLVVGNTGSGKTSVLNACLQSLPSTERCLLIEDTRELSVPNEASMRLVTREDPQHILKRIDQSELVRNALRLRPDRIVMGEMRGEEAKDFLMALSTGHAGSFGTLHASSAAQALIRLEMLVQMGAPHWSLIAIRRLIQMSLQAIVVVGRGPCGKRKLEGLYRLSSLEENGILLEKTG